VFTVGYYGDHSSSHDVFVSGVEEDSLLLSAFPGIDAEKLAEEERFLNRIAFRYGVKSYGLLP